MGFKNGVGNGLLSILDNKQDACAFFQKHEVIMKNRLTRIIFLVFVSLLCFKYGCFAQTGQFTDEDQKQVVEQLSLWLLPEDLSSGSIEKQKFAKDQLLIIAGESPQKRKLIIDTLLNQIKNLEKKDLMMSQRFFCFWESANYIFSETKAIEALDILIKYVHWNNGLRQSEPAPSTLSILGRSKYSKQAIAEISKSLHEGDTRLRWFMVIALIETGSPQSARILKNSLQNEKDEKIKELIISGLRK